MPSTAIDFHRLIVHFPVALLMFAALFHLLAVWRSSMALQTAAKANLVGGAILGLFASMTGTVASSEFGDRLLQTHQLIALGTVVWSGILAGLWLWKPTQPRSRGAYLVLGGLAVAAAGVGATGYLGGRMAHGHGVHGPKAYAPSTVPATAVGGTGTSGPVGEASTAAPPADTFPVALQPDHARFVEQCGTCHDLERSLQSSRTQEQWAELVARMADKTDGAITADDQAAIVRFLVWRSAHLAVPLPAR